MGVSVEGGRGRSKNLMVDLNLVPFIDFMSCLIAFLMIAAIWVQIAAIETEQAISQGGAPSLVPPLTVHIRAGGTLLFRNVEDGVELPKLAEGYDLARLEVLLTEDHARLPAEEVVVINTDDGVAYEEVMRVLDLSRRIGYRKTLFSGGPPAGPAPGGPPPVR